MTVLWSYESLRAQSLLLRKNLKTERINLEDFLDIWQQAKSLIRLLNLYKSQKNSTQWSFILTLKSADKIIILRTESQDISLWRLTSKNKALIDLSSVHKYLEWLLLQKNMILPPFWSGSIWKCVVFPGIVIYPLRNDSFRFVSEITKWWYHWHISNDDIREQFNFVPERLNVKMRWNNST